MNVTVERVDVPAPAGSSAAIRCALFRPVPRAPLASSSTTATATAPARWPTVIAYSDIFQLTGPHLRLCQRLCGYGFVVVAPELYARIEPPGTVLDFDADRQRALDDADKMELGWLDGDRTALLSWLRAQPFVDVDRLLCLGFCIGGHLAFRAAALEPALRATACVYATGLHSDSVGKAKGTATTLALAPQLRGRLLLVWGTRDPHIPPEGRQKIHRALAEAGTAFEVRLFDGEHTFMRDEGPRHEPVATDRAFADVLALFSPFCVAAP